MKTKEQKYLKELVTSAEHFIKNMDVIMQEPSTVERGKKIAQQLNALEMQKDQAKHFGLGIALDKKL
jgi:hypothetical protein